jgi:hypothetical protein
MIGGFAKIRIFNAAEREVLRPEVAFYLLSFRIAQLSLIITR